MLPRELRAIGVTVVFIVGLVACSSMASNRDAQAGRSKSNAPETAADPSTTAEPLPIRPPGGPALTVPAGVNRCRAENLEYAGGASTGLVRFFNRSQPCGLAGYPSLVGRTAAGTWVAIPARRGSEQPVSAELWSGVFDPSKTAVFTIRPNSAPSAAGCPGERLLAVQRYDGLRIELPDGAGTIELTDVADFDLGPCQPEVSAFGYDSNDLKGQ